MLAPPSRIKLDWLACTTDRSSTSSNNLLQLGYSSTTHSYLTVTVSVKNIYSHKLYGVITL
jgi:hypothetical protein